MCAFSSYTISCSCSMSATGAPGKALKVRPSAAKHYQLRHSCPLPNSLVKCVPGFTVRLLSCISQSELITVLTTGLVYCGSYTPSGMPGAQHADTAYQLLHVDKEWWIKIFVRHSPGLFSLHNLLMFALILGVMSLNCEYFLRLSCE